MLTFVLDDLYVTEIGALAELGGTYLEVHGKVVMRQARRISDLANDEDELLDLEDAEVRVHEGGEGLWDAVPGLTLNRDEVLMLMPISEASVSQDDLKAPGRSVRVKLYCGPLQVTGFVTVPVEQTVSGWHRTTRSRFLSVTQARVQPIQDDLKMDSEEGVYKFVLINRRRLTALIEARAGEPPNGVAPAPEIAAAEADDAAGSGPGEGWQPPFDPVEPAEIA
jgi:hypothetical protein